MFGHVALCVVAGLGAGGAEAGVHVLKWEVKPKRDRGYQSLEEDGIVDFSQLG